MRYVGLVGAGYWGKHLARNYAQLGVLHTICDLNPHILEERHQQYPEVAISLDFANLLSNPEITRVVIATPAKEHFSMARAAIMAGKDVYIEKPMCLSFEEGEELARLAEEREAVLMVGHILQYHPIFRRLVDLVKGGELGKLQYISSHRLNLGKICTEEDIWWACGPHDVAMILALTGQLPETVHRSGGTYLTPGIADKMVVTMAFPGNTHAHIYVSWLNPFKEQKLTVVGSDAMAVFDDTAPWKKKLALYRDPVSWSSGTPQPADLIPEWMEVTEAEPLREECLHFLHCCDKRLKPRTGTDEALQVLQVLDSRVCN